MQTYVGVHAHTCQNRHVPRTTQRYTKPHMYMKQAHLHTQEHEQQPGCLLGGPSSPLLTSQSLLFSIPPPPPHTFWPPQCLPWLEHLAKLLVQFLLKMFWSFLRRFFVSLKTFLIFSSNWRGVSLKVRTQAWKESGAPLGEEEHWPLSPDCLSNVLGLAHICLIFLFRFLPPLAPSLWHSAS